MAASLSEVMLALFNSFSSFSRLTNCICAMASSVFFRNQENNRFYKFEVKSSKEERLSVGVTSSPHVAHFVLYA